MNLKINHEPLDIKKIVAIDKYLNAINVKYMFHSDRNIITIFNVEPKDSEFFKTLFNYPIQ